jgi:hypothetical protein
MPLKHQNTEFHKKLIIKLNAFGEFLCFRALVAVNGFSEGTQY